MTTALKPSYWLSPACAVKLSPSLALRYINKRLRRRHRVRCIAAIQKFAIKGIGLRMASIRLRFGYKVSAAFLATSIFGELVC